MTELSENDELRGLLAWGSDPCVYCGLQAADMSRCSHGFPGCARADDRMAAPECEGWTRRKSPDPNDDAWAHYNRER